MTRRGIGDDASVGLLTYHGSIGDVWPDRRTGPRETWHDPLLEILHGTWRDPERQAVFVAVAGGEVVGFVRVDLRDDRLLPAHIETLFVAETHRGTGVARALVKAAERWCLDHGAELNRCWTIARIASDGHGPPGYVDTSGLFRRYDPFEPGATRVRGLCRPS